LVALKSYNFTENILPTWRERRRSSQIRSSQTRYAISKQTLSVLASLKRREIYFCKLPSFQAFWLPQMLGEAQGRC